MKALGVPVAYCARAGPVGQLGKAHAMLLLEVAGMLRGEEEVDPEGEDQPIEIGDDEADELGEYEKFISICLECQDGRQQCG